MKFCFYFCIPTCNGEIIGDAFIVNSLNGRFLQNVELKIYRCVINGLDTYVKEL